MIIDCISSEVTYYVTTIEGDWPKWQTNESGTYWLNLMGMSWEEMEPPQELVEEFLAAVTRSATNGD